MNSVPSMFFRKSLLLFSLLLLLQQSSAIALSIGGIILNEPPVVSNIFLAKSNSECATADFNSSNTTVSSFTPGTDYLCIRAVISDSSGNKSISLSDSNFIIGTSNIISASSYPSQNSWNFIKISTTSIGFLNCSTQISKSSMSNSDTSICAQLSPNNVSISLPDINSCYWSIKAVIQDTNKSNSSGNLTLSNSVSFSTTISACSSGGSGTVTSGGTASSSGSTGGGSGGSTGISGVIATPVEKGENAGKGNYPLIPTAKEAKIFIKTAKESLEVGEMQELTIVDKNNQLIEANIFIIQPNGEIIKLLAKNGRLSFFATQEGEYDIIAITKNNAASNNISFRAKPKSLIKKLASEPQKALKETAKESILILWLLCMLIFLAVYWKSKKFFQKPETLFEKIDEIMQKTIMSLSFALTPMAIDLLIGRGTGITEALIELILTIAFFGKSIGYAEKLSLQEREKTKKTFLNILEKIEKKE